MKLFHVAIGLAVVLYALDWYVWFMQDHPEVVRCNGGDVAADEYDRLRIFEDFLNSLANRK